MSGANLIIPGAALSVAGGSPTNRFQVDAADGALQTMDAGFILDTPKSLSIFAPVYAGMTFRWTQYIQHTTTANRLFTFDFRIDAGDMLGQPLFTAQIGSNTGNNQGGMYSALFTFLSDSSVACCFSCDMRLGFTHIDQPLELFGSGIILPGQPPSSAVYKLWVIGSCSLAAATEKFRFRHTIWEQLA